jgi:hypothetical protein
VIVLHAEDLLRAFREIRLGLKHADEGQISNLSPFIELITAKAKHRRYLLLG